MQKNLCEMQEIGAFQKMVNCETVNYEAVNYEDPLYKWSLVETEVRSNQNVAVNQKIFF